MHLPEAHGDFDMDALWMLPNMEQHWSTIADSTSTYEPGAVDHIFDLVPAQD